MAEVYKSRGKVPIRQTQGKREVQNGGAVGSFCYEPQNVTFATQDSREKIVLLLRQHPIVNVPWILMAILLGFAPSLLSYFPLLSFLPPNFYFIAIIFWYLIVMAFVVESALSWFFNVYIVTDERVLDVDFVNLIYREISEANIKDIQEVNSVMGGVAATIFNYGNVRIQTSSAKPTFEFESVPNPTQITQVLNKLREEEEQEALEGRTR